MRRDRVRRDAPWAAVAAALLAVGEALAAVGCPSSALFSGLVVGVTWALTLPGRLRAPRSMFHCAQAITGASGIGAMADALGADDRLVAFMQHLRVLVVVLVTPLLATLAFPGHHAAQNGVPGSEPLLGDVKGWLITVALALVAPALARGAHLPTTTLLGPLILSAIVTLAVPGGTFSVPPILRMLAFVAIGLQVGLRFTVATVREVGRLVMPVPALLLALLAGCSGLAVVRMRACMGR